MKPASLYSTLIRTDGGFRNIGKQTAQKLLADYGGAFTAEEFLAHLRDDNMDVFRDIKGVSDRAILGLKRGYVVLSKKLELANHLDKIGVEEGVVNKIFKLWGSQSITKINQNPYQLLFVMDWDKIDPIGRNLGGEYHPCRLVAAAENCMYIDYEENQNTCTTRDLLSDDIKALLNCSDEIADEAVQHALNVGAILEDNKVLQIPAAWSFERQTEHLLSGNRKYDHSRPKIENYLRTTYANMHGQALTAEQEDVVVNAIQNHLSAFYGRGGRGKTFTLRAICDAASDPKVMGHNKTLEPVLCAIAAKACQRMRKQTGRNAVTIAKILYRWQRRDLVNKIVIVDEASMVSLSDAYHLIKKVPDSSRLVLLGDVGQIPSIDAGRVLYDVIRYSKTPEGSKKIPSIELTINQRQDDKTDKLLESILGGEFPDLEDYRPGAGTGLYQAVVKDVFVAEEKARELYGLFKGQVQIISPLKRFAGGSDAINTLIHERFHHRSGMCPKTPVIFTRNKVLQIKSNGKSVELTNGSMGVIKEVLTTTPRSRDPYLKVEFEDEGVLALTWEEVTDHLDKAYCLTCHKAQGSDWDTVVVVLPKADKLVDRNMIYTALSRCKVRAILIYFDHEYVTRRIDAPAAHQRRRSALFGRDDV